MTTLRQYAAQLRDAVRTIRSKTKLVLFKEGTRLVTDFQQRSPVDTGFYRSRWRMSRDRFGSGGSIAAVVISNDTLYAPAMEFGIEKNQAPWFFPAGKDGKRKKRTGKLAVRQGRVWAGGLDPGHALTAGGAIDPVIFRNKKRQRALATAIANEVLGVFR